MQPAFDAVGKSGFDALVSWSSLQKSGEFVAATPGVEFHVYLREGCVAWATDSREPALFSRTIKQMCSIEDKVFADVVAECHRSRLPLGETLVTLGTATAEQVRAALRAQAERVIAALRATHDCQHMFLERPGFLRYRLDFTFALRDLVEVRAASVKEPVLGTPPVAFDSWAVELQRVQGADWVALVDGRSVVRHVGEMAHPIEVAITQATTLMRDRGGRLLAFQTKQGALVGVTVGPFTLWAHSGSSNGIGPLASQVVGLGLYKIEDERPPLEHAHRWKHQLDDPAVCNALEQVLQLDPNLKAVSVQRSDQRPAMGITSSAQHLSDLSEQHRQLFTALREACGIHPRLIAERLILATSTQTLFALQEQENDQPPLVVWVLAGTSCSLGMGLASLSAAARQLGRR
jgi:hypothetical protein